MEAAGKRWIQHGSRTDTFTIWNLADLHYGNRACAVDDIKKDVEIIRADPNAFWFGGGDYAEYIDYTDPRFDPSSVSEEIKIKDQGNLGFFLTSKVRDILFPIKEKCLGLLFGNHEQSYRLHKQQTHLHSWLCTELETKSLEFCALADLVFVRSGFKKPPKLLTEAPSQNGYVYSLRFFLHHGSGFSTTPAGKINKLIKFMDAFDADIYMIGHVHDQSGKRYTTIGANSDCTKLVDRQKLGVISGSYLKTYNQESITYGEIKGYAPTVLGSAKAMINPNKKEFWGEI